MPCSPRHTLAATAGTVTNGVLTFGAIVASGLTVGTSGADVIVSSTTFNSGQTVQVTSLTITEGNS